MINLIGTIFLSAILLFFAMGILWWSVILPRRNNYENDHKFSRIELRRITVSVMLIIISIMIFLSVTFISFTDRPVFWAYYMLAIFILLFGTILLAVIDSIEGMRAFLLRLGKTRKDIKRDISILEDELQKHVNNLGSNNGDGAHNKITKNN